MVTLLAILAIVVVLLIVGVNVIGFGLSLLWMLALGLVVGAIARLVVPGRQAMGLLVTALIGAVGSLLGGLLAREVFEWSDLGQFLTSIAVAAVLVVIAAGMGRDADADRTITTP